MLDKLLSECTDFPMLTALHVSAYRSSDDEDAPEYCALPPALLESGCLSRLRSVFFNNVAFTRWDLLKNLTMLNLDSSSDWDDTSQEVDSHELLALLQRSPQLQYLSLDRSHLPSDPNLLGAASSSLGSRVQLNALAELKLRGSVYALNTFLTCIDFPPSTSLSLILAALDHGSVCKAILPRLTPVLNHRNVPPVRMLRFEGALDSYMSVEGHEDERFSHASLLDEGHFRFTTYPSTHATTRRILTKFIHSFSLRSVTHVDFSSIVKVEGQFSRTTFAALFREMLWVKHIRIGVNNAMVAMLYGLIDVLQRNGKGLWGRRRRLLASHGPIRLTHLHLLPGHKGRRISEVHLDDSDEEAALYDELTIFLRSYQDLDIPTKPRGECWNTLDFDQPRTFGAGTFTAGILDPTIRRRISRLVKTLLIVGHDWSDRDERSMDLLTPPSTSHRSEKENRDALRLDAYQDDATTTRVSFPAAADLARIHTLDPLSPFRVKRSATNQTPAKSILKKGTALHPQQQELARDVTPEPSEPLLDGHYLERFVAIIVCAEASLRDLIEAYSILAARLRQCVEMTTNTDKSWPLLEPIRNDTGAFVAALVRDLAHAFEEPGTLDDNDALKVAQLPTPTKSPCKKSMSAEQVKQSRDLATVAHAVLKLLAVLFTFPALLHPELGDILTQVLALPLAPSLPTLNSRKTCALAIHVLQVQRLPKSALLPAKDRIAYAIRRGIDGELGKEGKKGAVTDGLRAIHDLSMEQPAVFVPAFNTILESLLENLLVPGVNVRLQATHALGGYAYGSSMIQSSDVHKSIAESVAEFIMTPSQVLSSSSSSQKSNDSDIVRALRMALDNESPMHVTQGPVWAVIVLSSFIVLLGPAIFTNSNVHDIIWSLIRHGLRDGRSPPMRSLFTILWRALIWAFFHPGYPGATNDARLWEEEEDRHWIRMRQVLEFGNGGNLIAALFGSSAFLSERTLRKTFGVLESMVARPSTRKSAVRVLGRLLEAGAEPEKVSKDCGKNDSTVWDLQRLLPVSLFSALPGLLSVVGFTAESLREPFNELLYECPDETAIRPFAKDDFVQQGWIIDRMLDVWYKSFNGIPIDLDRFPNFSHKTILERLIRIKLECHNADGDDEEITSFFMKVVNTLILVLEDNRVVVAVPKGEGDGTARKLTTGRLKSVVVTSCWSSVRNLAPRELLNRPARVLLTWLVNADGMCYPPAGQIHGIWSDFCASVLAVCDVDLLREFWSLGLFKPKAWPAPIRQFVWTRFAQIWKAMESTTWEQTAMLLAVPFTSKSGWESSLDPDLWKECLQHACRQAMDFSGFDSGVVSDFIAETIFQDYCPTMTRALFRAGDLLLSNLDMAAVSEGPTYVWEIVNEALQCGYPPDANTMLPSAWMLQSLRRVLQDCTADMLSGLLQSLENGLSTWIADECDIWTAEHYVYHWIPLYEDILNAIRYWLPRSIDMLRSVSGLLHSAFIGRHHKDSPFAEAFKDFWISYTDELEAPAEGWPADLQACLEATGIFVPAQEVDENDQAAVDLKFPITSFVPYCTTQTRPQTPPPLVFSCPSTPAAKTPCDSVLRRPSKSTRSALSPIKLLTPARSPLGSSTKRRRIEGTIDKENLLENDEEYVELGIKPINFFKRGRDDEQEYNRVSKKLRFDPISAPSMPDISVDLGKDVDVERQLKSGEASPHPGDEKMQTKYPQGSGSKRYFLDAVVIPLRRLPPRMRRTRSTPVPELPPATPSAKSGQRRSLTFTIRSGKRRRDSNDVGARSDEDFDGKLMLFCGNAKKCSLTLLDSDPPSSDSDPPTSDDFIGQVTPHHLVSPTVSARYLCAGASSAADDDSDDDDGSDDLPSSPSRRVLSRRLERAASARLTATSK
ncbi:hypothetical protein FISHEDRAFT_76855 [Fistulina hepatica ATCC 64428]|uniref:Telomere-associated protein Rif1 N-terminal domain-containing protein n=1 Tax=Fistulina hepatica ATCC 64428 TaxID=1128425 RepID=A0A0D7A5J6_9AGAR|nr:hypothetical protein FISHEDRAFT_76855 [Fistulina hepatica ATCC 64428]